jgi:hypothetical protein
MLLKNTAFAAASIFTLLAIRPLEFAGYATCAFHMPARLHINAHFLVDQKGNTLKIQFNSVSVQI